MTRDQAKLILAIYRPGIDDAEDPETAAALNLARCDAELAAWLDEHTALFHQIRSKLKQIEVPAKAAERLQPTAPVPVFFPRPFRLRIGLAAAASVALLVGLGVWWFRSEPINQFETFQSRMVRNVMERYSMNFMTNDLKQIRQYLADHQGHADYVLSDALEKVPGRGCVLLRWHDRPVSLICFALNEREDFYLFIVNRSVFSNPPEGSEPQLAKIGRFTAAGWTQGDKTYLLTGPVDEAFLRRYR